jgi:hypothetical protein
LPVLPSSCSHVPSAARLTRLIANGTVGEVCERLGRRWVGLELSADYIEIARKRTAQMGLSFLAATP